MSRLPIVHCNTQRALDEFEEEGIDLFFPLTSMETEAQFQHGGGELVYLHGASMNSSAFILRFQVIVSWLINIIMSYSLVFLIYIYI